MMKILLIILLLKLIIIINNIKSSDYNYAQCEIERIQQRDTFFNPTITDHNNLNIKKISLRNPKYHNLAFNCVTKKWVKYNKDDSKQLWYTLKDGEFVLISCNGVAYFKLEQIYFNGNENHGYLMLKGDKLDTPDVAENFIYSYTVTDAANQYKENNGPSAYTFPFFVEIMVFVPDFYIKCNELSSWDTSYKVTIHYPPPPTSCTYYCFNFPTITYSKVNKYKKNECEMDATIDDGFIPCETDTQTCQNTDVGFNCICKSGTYFDVEGGRTIRNGEDLVNADFSDPPACEANIEFKISTHSIIADYDTGFDLQFYRVSHDLSSELRLKSLDHTINVGSPYEKHGLDAGATYSIDAYLVDTYVGNFKVKAECGCRYSTVDADEIYKTGTPILTDIYQQEGLIFFNWRDDSECASAFELTRYSTDVIFENENSTEVTVIKGAQKNTFTSSYRVQSTFCESVHTPGTNLVDNIKKSDLKLNTAYVYCIEAINEELGYNSGEGCHDPETPDSLYKIIVRHEVIIKFRVLSKSRTPIQDLEINAHAILDNETYIFPDIYYTGEDGIAEIRLITTSAENEIVPFVFFFNKVSPSGIVHKFTCDTSKTGECDSMKLYLHHLNFDYSVDIIDETTVPIIGKVIIDNTNDCPISNIQVCLASKSNSNSDNCVYTDYQGFYELAATVGSEVRPYIKSSNDTSNEYYQHTFITIDDLNEYEFFEAQEELVYNGLDFIDTTTERLYLSFQGGLCKNIYFFHHVKYEIVKDDCFSYEFETSLNEDSIIVPATKLEVRLLEVYKSENDLDLVIGGFNSPQPSYFKNHGGFNNIELINPDDDYHFGGIPPTQLPTSSPTNLPTYVPTLKSENFLVDSTNSPITNLETIAPTLSPSGIPTVSPTDTPIDVSIDNRNSEDEDLYIKNRKVEFVYHPNPTVVVNIENINPESNDNADIIESICKNTNPFSVTQADENIIVNIIAYEQFDTGSKCGIIDNEIKFASLIGEPREVAERESNGFSKQKIEDLLKCREDVCQFKFEYDAALDKSIVKIELLTGAPELSPNTEPPHSKPIFILLETDYQVNRYTSVIHHVVIEGDVLINNFGTIPIPVTPNDVLIIRRPPGDDSYVSYTKSKSKTEIFTDKYDLFSGSETKYSLDGLLGAIASIAIDASGVHSQTKVEGGQQDWQERINLYFGKEKSTEDTFGVNVMNSLLKGTKTYSKSGSLLTYKLLHKSLLNQLDNHLLKKQKQLLLAKGLTKIPHGEMADKLKLVKKFKTDIKKTKKALKAVKEGGLHAVKKIEVPDIKQNVCGGLFVMYCSEVFDGKFAAQDKYTTSEKEHIIHSVVTKENTLETTWSVKTASSGELARVGEDADLFMLPNIRLLYDLVYRIKVDKSICEAKGAFQTKFKPSSEGYTIVDRYDIKTTILRQLYDIYENIQDNQIAFQDENGQLLQGKELREKKLDMEIKVNTSISDWNDLLERKPVKSQEGKAEFIMDFCEQELEHHCKRGSKIPNECCKQGLTCTLDNSINIDKSNIDSESEKEFVYGKTKCQVDSNIQTQFIDDDISTFYDNINVLSFYGGEQAYTFQTGSTHSATFESDDPSKQNKEYVQKSEFIWDIDVEVFGFDIIESKGETSSDKMGGHDFKENQEHLIIHKTHSHESVEVTFQDQNVGDHFDVRINKDENGLFYFDTLAGSSSCPPEKNTYQRHQPKITILNKPLTPVHPDEPFIYELLIENQGLETFNFKVYSIHKYVEDGARIYLGGLFLTASRSLDALHPSFDGDAWRTTVEVYRGKKDYDYPNLQIGIRPFCENFKRFTSWDFETELIDEYRVHIPAKFYQPCPKIKIFANTINNLLIFNKIDTNHNIIFQNLDVLAQNWKHINHIEEVKVQYRRENENIWYDIPNQQKSNLTSYEQLNRMALLTIDWEKDMELQDGRYELRGVVFCEPSNTLDETLDQSITDTINILVDRKEPEVFGLIEPADEEWIPGDDIKVIFNENIKCNIPYRFDIKLKMIDSEDNIKYFFDNDYLNIICNKNILNIAWPNYLSFKSIMGLKVELNINNIQDLAGNVYDHTIYHRFNVIKPEDEYLIVLVNDYFILDHNQTYNNNTGNLTKNDINIFINNDIIENLNINDINRINILNYNYTFNPKDKNEYGFIINFEILPSNNNNNNNNRLLSNDIKSTDLLLQLENNGINSDVRVSPDLIKESQQSSVVIEDETSIQTDENSRKIDLLQTEISSLKNDIKYLIQLQTNNNNNNNNITSQNNYDKQLENTQSIASTSLTFGVISIILFIIAFIVFIAYNNKDSLNKRRRSLSKQLSSNIFFGSMSNLEKNNNTYIQAPNLNENENLNISA